MVFKIINKLLKIIIIFFFMTLNSYANIIYDKNNIVISELDLNYYKKLHYEKFNEEINNSMALKTLVIIKKLIISLKKNNPGFLQKIDNEIISEIGDEGLKSQTVHDIFRYFKTRNEFVYNYFKNDFKKNDLVNIFKTFKKLKLPISDNNCLTIIKLIDLKSNEEFIDTFFINLKNPTDIYKISINDNSYNVCINNKNKEIIDNEIFKYIELKTQDDFDRFVYEQ